jgi:hypothetical protein
MSSAQELEGQVIPQEIPLMINDNVWLRLSPVRRARAYETQKMIDTIRLKASVDIYTGSDIVVLKFKSNKTKSYQHALEYINKYYTFISPSKIKGPTVSYHNRIYRIEFHLLPWWQPWDFIPNQY